LENKIIFATKNKNKIKEINMMLEGSNLKIISMEEASVDIDVVEDGKTFEENAIKKATEIMKVTNSTVLADDSGLEVDYMNKAPGIYSARYGGVETSYRVKNQMIMDELKTVQGADRSARFVCVIAAAFPNGDILTTRGTIEGVIAHEEKGQNGFGYDPIFYVEEYNCTTAEMSSELKNKISHRGKALLAMKEKLKDYYEKK
jgi:XTP/dITP diphosphohydrolase